MGTSSARALSFERMETKWEGNTHVIFATSLTVVTVFCLVFMMRRTAAKLTIVLSTMREPVHLNYTTIADVENVLIRRKNMRTTIIMNAKGGVGKTVTTINMAAELAARGKRVVCIDADPQCNLSSFFGGNLNGLTLYEVLTRTDGPRYDGLFQITQLENVWILPGSMDLILADVRALKTRDIQLAAICDLVLDMAADDLCDYVLIDSPPNFSAAVTAGLAAADDAIVPIKLDSFSIAGVEEMMRQIQGMREINPKLKVAGVLVTQYDGTTVARETAELLRESAVPVFGPVIRRTTAVDRSTFDRLPLREEKGAYAARAAEEYAGVVTEYLYMEGGAQHGV